MSHRKSINSHLIALIVTVVVEVAIIVAFDVNFGVGGESPKGEAIDEELFLDLENLTMEDFSISPQGANPKSQNESITDSKTDTKGPIKSQQTITPEVTEPDVQLLRNEPPVDSIKPKELPLVELKTDTVQPVVLDREIAEVLSKMVESRTNEGKTDSKASPVSGMTQQQKYEFYKKNYRLIRNFQKVYPYALKTRQIIEDVNARLATITSNSEKKKLIRDMETRLFDEYEEAVRKMTISQGKLLLKLIARETNKTGYELIREYKGAFSAGFWYSVGKLFGTDLKTDYHKELEDSLIENVLDKYKKNELY